MATTKKKAAKKKAKKIITLKKSAVKKKVVKKKSVKKSVKKSAAKKTRPSPRNAKIKVTPDQHYKMVCEAAYYISLDRTHETVNPTEDWFQAEAAINKICIIVD